MKGANHFQIIFSKGSSHIIYLRRFAFERIIFNQKII